MRTPGSPPLSWGRLLHCAIGLSLALFGSCLLSDSAHAQLPKLTGLPVLPVLTQPNWNELTPQQRQTLAPLAAEWGMMEAFRRKKWLGIAERFEKMSPEEQGRVRERMREWAHLAPEERNQVREKFKTLQKMTPGQREALRQNWADYKALPDEEKQRLKDKTLRRTPVSMLPSAPTKAPVQRKMIPRSPPPPVTTSPPPPPASPPPPAETGANPDPVPELAPGNAPPPEAVPTAQP